MDGLPVNTQDFPIWVNAAVFLAASIVVWSGGVRLTIYVDRISTLTRLGQVFAGMLLLGCVTSLPEVANVITASSAGIPALAVNNLLGSAAINVFFLAIGDAVVRRDALTSIVASPATLMMSVLCMLVLIAVAVAITTGDILLYGVGAWGLALAAVSVVSFWLSSGYADRSPWKVSDKREEDLSSSLRFRVWEASRRHPFGICEWGSVAYASACLISLFFRHLARALSDCLALFCLTATSSSIRRPWVMLSGETLKNGIIVGLIRAHCAAVIRAYRASCLSSFGREPPARHMVMSRSM